MKLLEPKEVKAAFKKEKEFNLKEAAGLSAEVSNLTKSFNRIRTDYDNRKKLLAEQHKDFVEDLENEREVLEANLERLKEECRTALNPLYEKEAQLRKTEDSLSIKERDLDFREGQVRGSEDRARTALTKAEKDLREAQELNTKTENLYRRLEEREIQFNRFMRGQKSLLEQNEDRLRKWLEKERTKLKDLKNAK